MVFLGIVDHCGIMTEMVGIRIMLETSKMLGRVDKLGIGRKEENLGRDDRDTGNEVVGDDDGDGIDYRDVFVFNDKKCLMPCNIGQTIADAIILELNKICLKCIYRKTTTLLVSIDRSTKHFLCVKF